MTTQQKNCRGLDSNQETHIELELVIVVVWYGFKTATTATLLFDLINNSMLLSLSLRHSMY